jgi:hypothetical protein
MSVFVDTGVFYAHHDRDASRHESGARALVEVLTSSSYGRVVTSSYVFDEAVTLTLRRTGRVEDAVTLGRRIRGDGFPAAIDLLHESPTNVDDAFEAFQQYDDQHLSFTDAMTVALIDAHDVDTLLSFDDDFDGLVDRLDPADVTTA